MKRKSNGKRHASSLAQLPPDPASLSHSELIAYYHTLQKQLAQLNKTPFPSPAAREARRQQLRAHLRLISLADYQAASTKGETVNGGFDSSQWVLEALRHNNSNAERLCVLDVGAIRHRFPDKVEQVKLDVTSIDLRPEDERVIRVDFFEYAREKESVFDVVCLSLCLNFVGCAYRRGAMLYLAARLLRRDGRVFIVLPKACMRNSRYCDESVWAEVLKAVGLEILNEKVTKGLFLCVARKVEDELKSRVDVQRKVVRGGDERNNFAVLLDWGIVEKELNRQGEWGNEAWRATEMDAQDNISGERKAERIDRVSNGGGDDGDGEVDVTKRRKKKRRRKKGAIQKVQLTSNQRKRARRKAMQTAGGSGLQNAQSAD